MIQEDFITLNHNNLLNNDMLDEETVIKSVFTPCYQKLNSWNSQKSNDVYFIKESSKFSENFQPENIFNKKDSFNSMQSFDDAYNNLVGLNEEINNLASERDDRLMSEENENENIPHFEKVDIMFANAGNEINDDGGVVINIIDPQKFAEKIKEKVMSLKREKKQRKYKPDDIRKKNKSTFPQKKSRTY
jgi:hypothetical protein